MFFTLFRCPNIIFAQPFTIMILNTPAYRIPLASALFDRNLFNRIVLLISVLGSAFRRLLNYPFRLQGLLRPLGVGSLASFVSRIVDFEQFFLNTIKLQRRNTKILLRN